jgi:hypothetical protein
MTLISRRTALGIAGAGAIVAAAGAAAVGSRGCTWRAAPASPGANDVAVDFVDRDGWMLTPAEGEKLSPARQTGA